MCGVPVERADNYLQRLIQAGHRVAVCEQVEDPAEERKRGGKAVVRRDVVRLVTPGTLTEDALLDPGRANLLVAVARRRVAEEAFAYGLAAVDISTGRFTVTETDGPGLPAALARLDPREIVVPDTDPRRPGARFALAGLRRGRDPASPGRARPGLRRAAPARALRSRDAGRLRRLRPGRDRRRRRGPPLHRANPARCPPVPSAAEPRRGWPNARGRCRDPRQPGAHPHAVRRALGQPASRDRPHGDAGRRPPSRRAAGRSAHRRPGDRRTAGRGGVPRRRRRLARAPARRPQRARRTSREPSAVSASTGAARATSPACATASSPPARSRARSR
jgi:hypothetical protein